jgi:hypothetical protein
VNAARRRAARIGGRWISDRNAERHTSDAERENVWNASPAVVVTRSRWTTQEASMKLWLTTVAAVSLLGIGPAGASGPAPSGAYTIQAQYYYDPYYAPYYYRYPGYGYYRYKCQEDLGYGRRGNWGCG